MQSAIAAGYKRGISTIVDANVVTLLTAFILFVLATAGVKGFAFTLGVGTITSLLTAVVFTQALLGTMSNSKLLRSPNALGAGGGGRRWHFDFMGASRWFFTLSGVILLIGAIALSTKELNFGIDFKSGTRITAALEKPTDETEVHETLENAGVANAEVQQVTVPHFGSNVFQIESAQLQPGKVHQTERALQDSYGIEKEGFESTSVGPTFGNQVAESAVKALIFSLLVILVYVALRFEPKFAVPVLIALFHDILITGGVYALTGKEVSSGTVAAFLTILGYSLYDTIIVFDRIRENVPRMPRAAFSQIVNRSMSEVLTRSLATSFTTLLAVLSLLVFGSATLQDFAFAMLIGIASGTYSSIFIASPVLTAWKEREPQYVRRRQRIAEAEGGLVPAFADDIQVAKLADDNETEAEIAADIEAEAPIAEATGAERRRRLGRGSVAAAEPGAGEAPKPAKRRGSARPPTESRRRPARTAATATAPTRSRRSAANGTTNVEQNAPSGAKAVDGDERGGSLDGFPGLPDDGHRPLALHRLPARPLLAGDRGRLPRRRDRRDSVGTIILVIDGQSVGNTTIGTALSAIPGVALGLGVVWLLGCAPNLTPTERHSRHFRG